ncbi:MAG: hypothetical protein M1128_01280 [Candidatus Marsarchaeota archaeon]|nr:hypothetical protein [Candidatus Marsarchaeota archaeon]
MKCKRTAKYHKNKLYGCIEALTRDANIACSMDLMKDEKELEQSDEKFSREVAKITEDLINLRKLSEGLKLAGKEARYTVAIELKSDEITYSVTSS